MQFLDPHTIILITGVMGLMMAMVLHSLRRNCPPSVKGLSQWAIAPLLLFIGTGVTALRGGPFDTLSIMVSNLIFFVGVYITLEGSQRFFDVAPRFKSWMTVIAGFWLAITWFTVVQPAYPPRLFIFTFCMMTLMGAHAWLLYRHAPATFSGQLALSVMVVGTAVQAMRCVTSVVLPTGVGVFDRSAVHLIYLTTYSFTILLTTISQVVMTTDRMRLEFEHLANHDSLTDAFTRRHMNEAVQLELDRTLRHGRPVALLIMDLDHFKTINDTYGHQTGDQVLIDFVALVKTTLRRPDQLGRFGGEEFIVLLPESSRESALITAERIRVAVEQAPQPACTVSIGLTISQPGDTLNSLVARADAAMYRAKDLGRNRVEVG